MAIVFLFCHAVVNNLILVIKTSQNNYGFLFQFFLQVAECCGYPLKYERFLIEQSMYVVKIIENI